LEKFQIIVYLVIRAFVAHVCPSILIDLKLDNSDGYNDYQ
jgi:hypothetical protein